MASLSAVFSWSIPREWRDTNPCKGVPRIAKGDAFAPWPDDKIALLSAHAPQPIYWAAMAGCSDAEMAAITGQTRQMVAHYTKGVDQKRLAAAAIHAQVGGGRSIRKKGEHLEQHRFGWNHSASSATWRPKRESGSTS